MSQLKIASKLPVVLVLAWLAAFVWLLGHDRYTAFLAEKLQPVLVMAVVLLVLFLVGMLSRRGQGGGSLRARLLQAGVLLLPLAYMTVVVPPEGLGSYAFATRSLHLKPLLEAGQAPAPQPIVPPAPEPAPAAEPTQAEPAAAAPPVAAAPAPAPSLPVEPPAEAILLNPMELNQRYDQYEGKLVATEGMVARPGQLPAGSVVVFRFVISCCVSDAMPVGVLVRVADADRLAEDTWVRVEGTLRVEAGTFGKALILEGAKATAIPAPTNPYLNEFGGGGMW